MSQFLHGLVTRAAGIGAGPQLQPRHEPRFLPGSLAPAAVAAPSEEEPPARRHVDPVQPPDPAQPRLPSPRDPDPVVRARPVPREPGHQEASGQETSRRSGPGETGPDPQVIPVARQSESVGPGRVTDAAAGAGLAPRPDPAEVNDPAVASEGTAARERSIIAVHVLSGAPLAAEPPHPAAPPIGDAAPAANLPIRVKPAPPPALPKLRPRIEVHIGRVELGPPRRPETGPASPPPRAEKPAMPRGFESLSVTRRYLDRIAR